MIKDLMYIELKTGYSDDGPAWIGYVKTSKTKKTIYFNDPVSYTHLTLPTNSRV